jgi:hypothetical protein
MLPDFLNSREDAILVWAVVIVGCLTYKHPRWNGSTWDMIRAFFVGKLMLAFGLAALYSAGIVLLADRIGLWHTTALKETIYWFLGGGVVLVGKAIEATPGWDYFRDILHKALSLTIFVAFIVNFYVLPLGYEMVLVLFVLVFTVGRAAAPFVSGAQPSVSKTIDGALTGIGLLLLAMFAFRAIFDPGGLFTRETAERFFVVPILTIALVPYLLALAWYCRREVAHLRRRQFVQV